MIGNVEELMLLRRYSVGYLSNGKGEISVNGLMENG